MRKPSRSPIPLAIVRGIVNRWEDSCRARDEEDAQTNYLEALAAADGIVERSLTRTKRLPKAQREREMALARQWAAEWVRDALDRCRNPTNYSTRVTGADLCAASRVQTVPKESRGLAGVRMYAIDDGMQRGRRKRHCEYGPQARTHNFVLRSGGGRILASVLIAGDETDLHARLLQVLMQADQRGSE